MSKRPRRNHAPVFKAKMALAAIRSVRIKHDDWGARQRLKVLQGRHPRRRD